MSEDSDNTVAKNAAPQNSIPHALAASRDAIEVPVNVSGGSGLPSLHADAPAILASSPHAALTVPTAVSGETVPNPFSNLPKNASEQPTTTTSSVSTNNDTAVVDRVESSVPIVTEDNAHSRWSEAPMSSQAPEETQGSSTQPSQAKRTPPRGWLECEYAGKPILKVIAMKVPLREEYDIGDRDPWTPHDVHEYFKKKKTEIGLIIDLTYTDKYYDRNSSPVPVRKMALPGKTVPSPDFVNDFCRTITDFCRANRDKYVAVHCTHGHNRTGFMMVCYLLSVRRISLNDALDMFAKARPPGLYRQGLRDYLFDRYRSRASGPPRAIPAPPWDTDDGDRGVVVGKDGLTQVQGWQALQNTERHARSGYQSGYSARGRGYGGRRHGDSGGRGGRGGVYNGGGGGGGGARGGYSGRGGYHDRGGRGGRGRGGGHADRGRSGPPPPSSSYRHHPYGRPT